MTDKAGKFADNLSVIANVTELTMASLTKIGRNDSFEINAASRDVLIKRIQHRLASNIRLKSTVK